MENWQLVLVTLSAVLVGALIPAIIAVSLVLFKVGREITEISRQIKPILGQIQVVSDRVEVLSCGLEGGEKSIAEFLASLGDVARGLDRNMKIFDISSAVVASLGPAVTAFVHTMRQPEESTDSPPPNDCAFSGDDQPTTSASASRKEN